MTNLYLQYRALSTDPWTQVPDLTSAFPTLPVGALPMQSITITSEPQSVTPLCCADAWLPVPSGSADDSFLILRAVSPPIPLALEASIVTFLINYKSAAYHEAKYDRYGLGGYITALLSLIEAKERHGSLHLSFRLAAAMADALINT
ncbi:MAG TPA: hypothetical protein VFX22_02275 [Candidatus Kapabacteria bacterium]|nr:hypothetical protein [Candidatus Kapabacteria bacterium]